MKTITLMTDNRTGLLSDVSYILGKNRINIEGFEVDEIGDKAIISLTVRNSEKATKILEMNGFTLIEKNGGLLVKVEHNGTDGLTKLKEDLAEKGITIENATLVCGNEEKGMFQIDVDRPRKANRIMEDVLPNLS